MVIVCMVIGRDSCLYGEIGQAAIMVKGER